MKFLRGVHPETKRPFYGQIDGDRVLGLLHEPYDGLALSGEQFSLDEITLLAPCDPGKIVAGGANYRSHLLELGLAIPKAPVFFLKAPSSLTGPDSAVDYPDQTKQLEFEAELAIVVGKKIYKSTPEQARDAIFGYTIVNDVTARDIQFKDNSLMHMPHAKSFDTFCPCGPWIETDIADPGNLEFQTTVNGGRLQVNNTNDMIFSIPDMLSYFSHIMTLNPGDLVATGTPTTSAGLSVGDIVSITFDRIGTLTNTVRRL